MSFRFQNAILIDPADLLTLSKTLPTMTLSSAAIVDVEATVAKTLPAPTLSTVITVDVEATSAVTLPAMTLVSAVSLDITATSAQTLPAPTLAAAVSIDEEATLAVTLPAMTTASATTVDDELTLTNGAIPTMTLASAVSVDVEATLGVTLPVMTLVSVLSPGETEATLDQTLPAMTLLSIVGVDLEAALAGTLPALTLVTEITVDIAASLGITLPVMTSSGVIDISEEALLRALIEFNTMTLSATVTVDTSAHTAVTLQPMHLDSTVDADNEIKRPVLEDFELYPAHSGLVEEQDPSFHQFILRHVSKVRDFANEYKHNDARALDQIAIQAINQEAFASSIDFVTSVNAQLGQKYRQLFDETLGLSQRIAELALSGQYDVHTLRSDVHSQQQNAEAFVTSQISALTGQDLALAARIDTVYAALGGISSSGVAVAIQTLFAQVSSNSAGMSSIASSVTLLQAQLAEFSGDAGTVGSALVAFDTRVSAIDAELDSQATFIAALQSAVTGYSGSNAIANAFTSLDTRTTANESGLTAQATSITALSTTVGGHTTTIAAQSSSLNGISAYWGVALDVDGHITGKAQLDGGVDTPTTMDFLVDVFRVFANGIATPIFTLSGAEAVFNVPLRANLVNTVAIAANSVTLPNAVVINYNSTPADVSAGLIIIATNTLTTIGGPVMTSFQFLATPVSGRLPAGVAAFFVDGVEVGPELYGMHAAIGGWNHIPAAGTHTYEVKISRFVSGAPVDDDTYNLNGNLMAVEFRR